MIKKIVKICIIMALCLLFVCCAITGGCYYTVSNTQYKTVYHENLAVAHKYEYIIVPGAKVFGDIPSLYLQFRLDTAYALYTQDTTAKIIVSGGYDTEYQIYEPDVMKNYLLEKGVAEENIIIDKNGIDTFNTMQNAKEIVGDAKVMVCSQEMYLDRTMYIANHTGLDAQAASSDIVVLTGGLGKVYIREYVADTKAVFECLTKGVAQ